jgi:hypothetical protein
VAPDAPAGGKALRRLDADRTTDGPDVVEVWAAVADLPR